MTNTFPVTNDYPATGKSIYLPRAASTVRASRWHCYKLARADDQPLARQTFVLAVSELLEGGLEVDAVTPNPTTPENDVCSRPPSDTDSGRGGQADARR